jgi:hypothetical protein
VEPRFGKSITSIFGCVSTSQNRNTVNSKKNRPEIFFGASVIVRT